MSKFISMTELKRRLEAGCPKCGPMYTEHEVDSDNCVDDGKPLIVLRVVCHAPECNHVFGRVAFVPKEK